MLRGGELASAAPTNDRQRWRGGQAIRKERDTQIHACRQILVVTTSPHRQRHTKRQATQHGSLPSLLDDGDKGIELVYGEKKEITGPTTAAKAVHKSLVPERPTQRRKDPFHLSSLSPHAPHFQQSAGRPPLFSLSAQGCLKRQRENGKRIEETTNRNQQNDKLL
jgi:hypothetical protein